MDAKNIYIAINHMKQKIDWEQVNDNEWSYVGDQKDFEEIKVNNFVSEYFSDEELYVVKDRHNAFEIAKSEAAIKVKELLYDLSTITLCNKAFNQMIEFSYIGVAKHGKIGI